MPAHYARHQLAARGAVAKLRYQARAGSSAAPQRKQAPGPPSAALRTSGGIQGDTTRLAPLLPPLPDPEVVDLKQDSRYSKAHDRASDQEDQRSGIGHPVAAATATCR